MTDRNTRTFQGGPIDFVDRLANSEMFSALFSDGMALVGLGVLLWIGTIVRGENFGNKFDRIAPRYRRARQFT